MHKKPLQAQMAYPVLFVIKAGNMLFNWPMIGPELLTTSVSTFTGNTSSTQPECDLLLLHFAPVVFCHINKALYLELIPEHHYILCVIWQIELGKLSK